MTEFDIIIHGEHNWTFAADTPEQALEQLAHAHGYGTWADAAAAGEDVGVEVVPVDYRKLARRRVREVVSLAMEYWPNAHLGDQTRDEDLQSAFAFLRARLSAGYDIYAAASALEIDAYRHQDM